ncbi:unnamed protein product [Malus baccata var. baccata]
MERSMCLLSAAFIIVLLLAATGRQLLRVGHASQSNRFNGTCVSKRNCAVVCQTKGFLGGWCLGLRCRCFCTQNC